MSGGRAGRGERHAGRPSMSSWERWIKRYVWDDKRTPYLTSPDRMTRHQADYEIFAYCVFLCCLFIIVAVASAGSPLIAVYAFSVVCIAMVLGVTKHVAAAGYCATTPFAAAAYLAFGGFPGDLGIVDHGVLIVVILLWARYGLRVISVARAYEGMADS